jgi:hypothetical protein
MTNDSYMPIFPKNKIPFVPFVPFVLFVSNFCNE